MLCCFLLIRKICQIKKLIKLYVKFRKKEKISEICGAEVCNYSTMETLISGHTRAASTVLSLMAVEV